MSICSGCIVAFAHWLASGVSQRACDICGQDFAEMVTLFSNASKADSTISSHASSSALLCAEIVSFQEAKPAKETGHDAKLNKSVHSRSMCSGIDTQLNHEERTEISNQHDHNLSEKSWTNAFEIRSMTSNAQEPSNPELFELSERIQSNKPHLEHKIQTGSLGDVMSPGQNDRGSSSDPVVLCEPPVTPINRCAESENYLESIKTSIRKAATTCYTPFPRISASEDWPLSANQAVESPAWLTRIPFRLPPESTREEIGRGITLSIRGIPQIETPLKPRKISSKRLSEDQETPYEAPAQKLQKVTHAPALWPGKSLRKSPSPPLPSSPPRNSLIYSPNKGLARRKLLGVPKRSLISFQDHS